MRSSRALTLVAVCAVMAGFGLGLSSACSLGLDESLIGKGAPDSAFQPPTDGTAPPLDDVVTPGDAVVDTGPPLGPTSCAVDTDCKAPNACLTGRCNLPRKTCVYEICKPSLSSCTAGTCNASTKVCGTANPYKFKALTFPVTQGGIGCGGAPSRCFAAVHPFVFVGTTSGVFAYSALDPNIGAPTPISITGLSFIPQAIVASGQRIYYLGSVFGSSPNYRLQIAWTDVGSDPFATVITAKTVLVNYTRGGADLLFPSVPGESFVIQSTTNFPTASLVAPFTDPAKVDPLTLNGFPSAQSPVAASGSRVLFQTFSGTGSTVVTFSLETGAGTNATANQGDQMPAVGPVVSQNQFFGQGPDGSVFWTVAAVNTGPPTSIKSVRIVWLLADGAATTFTSTPFVDVDNYTAAGVPQVVGPVAWVDKDTAVMAHTLSSNLSQTNIRLVNRANTVTKGFTVAFPVGQIAVAASAGWAYALSADSATTSTVSVIAPQCSP